ncbi:prolyl hydroxylase family protein [Flocculibacter collagenilyticus]|uniref:prolyl hydroxylase family protein n=1 Tax=Flocculibacter collagenilyticus TaxID=2744479 RepID=UPI0018F61B47|nr:2OG-Fe(II) oxygenase [Flocculibacter collagenilyticus]
MQNTLYPSKVTVSNGDDKFRTSFTCDLGDQQQPFIDDLDQRISAQLGISVNNSESIQGQKYNVGQEFKAHTDYFEPGTLEYQKHASAMGQRAWSFMVYLNTTIKGGETYFPNLGVTIKPKKGMALIWNNLLPEGACNPATLHHAMPVISGDKYVVTKWFRTRST